MMPALKPKLNAVEEVVGFAMSVVSAFYGQQLDGTICKAKGGCACQSTVHYSCAGHVKQKRDWLAQAVRKRMEAV